MSTVMKGLAITLMLLTAIPATAAGESWTSFDVVDLCAPANWKLLSASQAKQTKMWRAIKERALSDEEFAEALEYGDQLNIFSCESFSEEQKRTELLIAVERQKLLRKMKVSKE